MYGSIRIMWDQNLFTFMLVKIRGLCKRNLYAALLATAAGPYLCAWLCEWRISSEPKPEQREHWDTVKRRQPSWHAYEVRYRVAPQLPSSWLLYCPEHSWLHVLEGTGPPPLQPRSVTFWLPCFRPLEESAGGPHITTRRIRSEGKKVWTIYLCLFRFPIQHCASESHSHTSTFLRYSSFLSVTRVHGKYKEKKNTETCFVLFAMSPLFVRSSIPQ